MCHKSVKVELKMDRKRIEAFASIPKKANRVLFFFLIAMLIIILRIWNLAVVQQDRIEQTAARMRKKLSITPAYRGTIRDRFHFVLAANAIDYRVGVQWAPILEIPRKIIVGGAARYLRKEYVEALCKKLGDELDEDPTSIEDVLYSYAAFAPNTPVILKTKLHERDYYRLNMLAKQWPGLVVESSYRRVYPRGRVASHLLGYTASLNRDEYDSLLIELSSLKVYVDAVERGEERDLPLGCFSFFEAKKRLMMLERMSYGFNDEIGKMGIESSFERALRGFYGKKYFYTNAHGDLVRVAPGSSDAISGKRLVLTISARLQEECERLLAASEKERASRLHEDLNRIQKGAKDPFVRGGAIIAMDPKTGEILACASYPRFNPNDFVRPPPCILKKVAMSNLDRWMESESYVRKVFDCEIPLIQETVQKEVFQDIEQVLSWDLFLQKILPKSAKEASLLRSNVKVGAMLKLQDGVSVASDLSRLLLRKEELSKAIIDQVSGLSIKDLRALICAKVNLSSSIKKEMKIAFTKYQFKVWRETEWVSFLAEKRKQEAMTHRPLKPFVKYLEAEKERQFNAFWQEHEKDILLFTFGLLKENISDWVEIALRKAISQLNAGNNIFHKDSLLLLKDILQQLPNDEAQKLLSSLKGYDGLTFPLCGIYTSTSHAKRPKIGQDLVKTILSLKASPMTSLCYMNPSAPGSIFKLIVAFCALQQQVESFKQDIRHLSPNILTMTDRTFIQHGRTYVGIDSMGRAIPQLYKGGRIPRSVHQNNGYLDLVSAIAKSSNPYFAVLASEVIDSPKRLIQTARDLGYGKKTGISLPSEASGRVPSDLETNKTGLYTTAIGQHTLLATPLQTAVALAAFSNGGKVVVPRLVKVAIGPQIVSEGDLLSKAGIGSRSLQALGISVPLWLAGATHFHKRDIEVPSIRVRKLIPILPQEKAMIYQGMKGALLHALEDVSLRKMFHDRPNIFSIVQKVKQRMIGKSSTAESFERLGLGIGQPPCMYNHTWFAGLYFDRPIDGKDFFIFNDPSLVVVVFLRYGTYGKDAAHIAACVCHEWDEIRREQHENIQF